VRTLGWLLVVYAAIGLVLLMAAVAVGLPMVGRVQRLADSANGSIQAAAGSAQAASDALAGFDDSFAQAQQSAADAATLSRDAAQTLLGLSNAMNVSILGTQPLVGLADDFAASADQLAQLGQSLEQIGQAMETSQGDVSTVAQELHVLTTELTELAGATEAELAGASPPLSWLFVGFLAWQAVQVVAAGLAGLLILRDRSSSGPAGA
jgi:phage-related protein